MAWDLLIRNGQCVLREGVRQLDLAIEDGKIVALEAGLRGSAREEIDAAGLHIFPGVIDPHVHFNEPGRTDWEGFATGTAALAAGGGTCFFDMPLNSSPPTLDGPSFDLKLEAAKRSSLTDFAVWGGLTPKNLGSMEELAERGVIGFKAFMSGSGIDDFERADDYTLYRGMQTAARLGLIVAVHAENDAMTAGLAAEAIREGRTGWMDYLRSRPVIAEVEAITRIKQLAAETNCNVHIVHVSSEAGAWASHVDDTALVSYETCPHYFLLTEEDLPRIGARAKCAPPLRTQRDVNAFQDLFFRTGEISFVASDHSPAPASMKQGEDAFKIWGGIAGVQSTLAAMISIDPALPPASIANYTSGAAAERFGVDSKGVLDIGFDADIALVDLWHYFELTRDMLLDRHKLSPYVGRQFRGLVKRTISRGQTIFLDGKIVGKPQGKLVKPMRKERAG